MFYNWEQILTADNFKIKNLPLVCCLIHYGQNISELSIILSYPSGDIAITENLWNIEIPKIYNYTAVIIWNCYY